MYNFFFFFLLLTLKMTEIRFLVNHFHFGNIRDNQKRALNLLLALGTRNPWYATANSNFL